MTFPSPSIDRTLQIYISLAQYPILKTQIRERMRRELFERGVITRQDFEAEVRRKAVRSQTLEGVHNPLIEEPADVWELRLGRVRNYLTDFYFAYNLPGELFEDLIRQALLESGAGDGDYVISFNPELAPQNLLFEQAFSIEKLPPADREMVEARLREIKVVLIRTLISDQLAYVKIAKDWLKISDLHQIRKRKIGGGKIGGKSAGILLASRILKEVGDDEILNSLKIPDSYYLGADLTYEFMTYNDLMHWSDQKYKTEDQIRADYPLLQKEFIKGSFPPDILDKIQARLKKIGNQPLIVRSSSLLEDNFGTSFAGKYESYFCPNQGSPEENLEFLTHSISKIYASTLNPDALVYRRAKGLQDYDERMAILIQVVQGEKFGDYFLPHSAGVAFSRNLYRWSPMIKREAGFLRLVWGLGTRAVERVGSDYPRLVALSHPLLRPEVSTGSIRRYSQQYVDLIDLKENQFKTLPITQVLSSNYPVLRYLAQIDQGGYLTVPRSILMGADVDKLVLTFDEMLRRTPLAKRLSKMLQLLEKQYHLPVDTEIAVKIIDPSSPNPDIEISLLQCRPQSQMELEEVRLPKKLNPEDVIMATSRMAPQGRVSGIRYVVFVPPESYYSLPSPNERGLVGRLISKLNRELSDQVFICVGPGRWGTTSPDIGIKIGYSDIFNTRALVELSGSGVGTAPEASFGTHFFQDLVESNIYPLAVYFDDEDAVFNPDFFYNSPNKLLDFVPESDMTESVRVIDVHSFRENHLLELVMDDEKGKSVAFLVPEEIAGENE